MRISRSCDIIFHDLPVNVIAAAQRKIVETVCSHNMRQARELRNPARQIGMQAGCGEQDACRAAWK